MTKGKTTNNLGIWENVEATDPEYTKKVNQRGGFTSIDAYYQIKEATKLFGAVGTGWGWSKNHEVLPSNILMIDLTLWYMADGEKREINSFGTCQLIDSKGRPDQDAPKKALTDAITKSLSYLGFNTDVFMGRFDDNKYVDGLLEEKEKAAAEERKKELEALKEKRKQVLENYEWLKDALSQANGVPEVIMAVVANEKTKLVIGYAQGNEKLTNMIKDLEKSHNVKILEK